MRNVRYLQVSHLSCGRGSLSAQGGFTVFMNQKSRTICSVLKNVGCFSVPPPAPWSSAGFLFNWVLFYVLNI